MKLSPTDDNKIIDILFEMGFRKFHLVNTLKTDRGARRERFYNHMFWRN